MLHRRTCEVRVSQARHLVAKERKRNGDDKLLVADVVWVLMSVDGKHNTTEGCRDIDNPSWQRVATFDVDLRDPGEGSKDARQGASSTAHASRKQQQQPQPRQKKNNSASATLDRSIASRLAPSATAMEQKTENFAAGKRPSSSSNPFAAEVVPETQSLNPFASNFVPPPSSPPTPPKAPPPAPPPPPSPPAKLRTSLVLHLRVLNGRLSAKEVLGDVAVDLVPLLRSGGERLATDRLGWLRSEDCMPLERLVQSDGDGGAAPVAVDTWVSLRQGNAELRVQLRIRPAAGLQGGLIAALFRHQKMPMSLRLGVGSCVPVFLASRLPLLRCFGRGPPAHRCLLCTRTLLVYASSIVKLEVSTSCEPRYHCT